MPTLCGVADESAGFGVKVHITAATPNGPKTSVVLVLLCMFQTISLMGNCS